MTARRGAAARPGFAGSPLAVALLAAILALGGCSFRSSDDSAGLFGPPPADEVSPLQLRQLQVRDYPDAEVATVMRAVIATLQDEGFTIASADAGLGLISASLDAVAADRGERRRRQRFWFAAEADSTPGSHRLEASISVADRGGATRVRLGFVRHSAGGDGVARSETVRSPELYRELFVRLDRAVFFEAQRL